jgi:hypothetical protein
MRSIQRANLAGTARAEDEDWDLYEKISEMPNSSVYQQAKLMSWTTGKGSRSGEEAARGWTRKNREDHPRMTGRGPDNADPLARNAHKGRAGRVQAVGDLKDHIFYRKFIP